MNDDEIIGDGGNVTVYERPDRSQYALDKRGGGSEWPRGAPVFGRARFDARPLSNGRWEGSRSAFQALSDEGTGQRARSRGGSRLRTS